MSCRLVAVKFFHFDTIMCILSSVSMYLKLVKVPMSGFGSSGHKNKKIHTQSVHNVDPYKCAWTASTVLIIKLYMNS